MIRTRVSVFVERFTEDLSFFFEIKPRLKCKTILYRDKMNVFFMDIKLSSVDSIHSVLHGFTLVDSRISVLDFC